MRGGGIPVKVWKLLQVSLNRQLLIIGVNYM